MDHLNHLNQTPDSLPPSIGFLSQLAVAECIRKWIAGVALTERERQVVDEARTCNRLQMIRTVFAETEAADADR